MPLSPCAQSTPHFQSAQVLLAIELNPQALSNLTTWASDSEFSMPANANGADDSLDQPDDRGGGKSGRGPSKGQ